MNSSEAFEFLPLKLVRDPEHDIFHCFKHEGNYGQQWHKKPAYAQNIHMLRTSVGAQNLRLKHFDILTFVNCNTQQSGILFLLI